MKEFNYYKPKDLKEASDILLSYNGEAQVLNGGTDVIVRIHENLSQPKALVDIKGIDGLNEISFNEAGGLFIGGCITMNEIMRNKDILSHYRVIAEAAHTVGSTQVRNRATLVGNITNASPLADTATPLLALNATLLVFGPDGEREIDIHDFFVFVRKTSLKLGEVVVGVKIPFYKQVVGGYQKHSRRDAVDLSTVCGTIVKADGEVRIALGSVAPTPIRCRKTESFLANKPLTENVINEASSMIVQEISPIKDVRASKEYREEISTVIVKRGLLQLKD